MRLFYFFILLLSPMVFACKHYEAYEHIAMGDQVMLFSNENDNGSLKTKLKLPNGLELTYGEILTLGDYYGSSTNPIALEKTEVLQAKRFQEAFDAFSTSIAPIKEIKSILTVLHHEGAKLREAIAKGEDPELVYHRLSEETNRKLNFITGGSGGAQWWLRPGRYLRLAMHDYDHFGDEAYLTYKVGHKIALAQALIAHRSNKPEDLDLAYAINAFACHFLSDRFSAGHIRTPRIKLPQSTSPQLFGTILSHFMHSEENHYGFYVKNNRGDHWFLHGDKNYFSEKDYPNKRMLSKTLQLSADEIYIAYRHGTLPTSSVVDDYIPYPDPAQNAEIKNIAPLFFWDNEKKQLLRRQKLDAIFDHHWTNNWWAFTTLISLIKSRGLTGEDKVILSNKEVNDALDNEQFWKNKQLSGI